MALTNRQRGTVGTVAKTIFVAVVVLCMIGLSMDIALASSSGDNSNGLISRLIDTNIFNNYLSLATHHGSHVHPPVVPSMTTTAPPVIGNSPTPTPTVLPTPTRAPVPTVLPTPTATPTHVYTSPTTIESIYSMSTPGPVSGGNVQAAAKQENTTDDRTVVQALLSKIPLGMVDLSGSMAVSYNVGNPHTASESARAKSSIPDMLILLNLIVPIAAVGVILSDRLARKGK